MISGEVLKDTDWGCDHYEMLALATENIRACKVSVSDISKLATELTRTVVDTSWMASLDKGARRSYEWTVAETAEALVEIFQAASQAEPTAPIQDEFGELMVSMGAARALCQVFSHCEVPLAELWKPRLKQNEGFDFHTVCGSERVHFGEAKYSAKRSPHGSAIGQIGEFLAVEKHFRDRPHLEKLVSEAAIGNLDDEDFGVVAAFSINAECIETVLKNAIGRAKELSRTHKISQIYLVGVIHES